MDWVEPRSAKWIGPRYNFLIYNTTIIPVLLATNKIVLIEHIGDITQWPIYLTICNSSHEIRRPRIRFLGIIISFIPIYKGNSLKLKIDIYYQTMGVIIKGIFKFLLLYIIVWLGIVLEKVAIESVLIICIDKSV